MTMNNTLDDFQEYLLTLNPPISTVNLDIIKKIELNTRSLKLPAEEIVKELIANGMYRLTALDIVTSAQAYFKEQEARLLYPLGIFWDVENVRIPSKTSGEQASSMLKQALTPLGNPVLCNAYFESNDASTMTPEKRQKLQQCGWNLMDVPHLSKKEVADKIILVDILLFVLDHAKEQCTICLISDDNDFSYLLARLKSYPLVKTVIISKTPNLSASNADVSMRWGVDILKVPVLRNNNVIHNVDGIDQDEDLTTQSHKRTAAAIEKHGPLIATLKEEEKNEEAVAVAVAVAVEEDDMDDLLSCSEQQNQEYDRTSLVTVMRNLTAENHTSQHLKSLVGIRLTAMNPQAYSDKQTRNRVFERAIQDGLIVQTGTLGGVKIELTRYIPAYRV